MRRTLPAVLLPAALLFPLLPAAPASAAPTCYAGTPAALCGGRVVAEPQDSTTFHQFDGPLEGLGRSLEAIEARSPRYLEVGPISEFTGDPAHVSAGGRALWVVRITDEQVPRAGKKQVAASLSVHGLEAAGREGGLRYVEDLAIASAALPGVDVPMHSGDVERPTSQVLRETEAWIAFPNPDGWAAGDLTSSSPGPGFVRANDAGQDLNRDYATVGWYDRDGGSDPQRGVAESEPETRAWTSLVKSFPDLATSTDVHGENTTPNQAFSDLIIPAGQWAPKRQAQVQQLGQHMIRSIERAFDEQGVVLDTVFGPLPDVDGSTPRRPANVAASYDIVGYDDSGFMGDWFSQTQDSVHMDVENFLSNLAPNNAYVPAVEQAHVAAVRGILEATTVEATVTRDVQPVLDMKRVAYVDDPARTTSADGVGTGAAAVAGETQVPYDVSRLAYFEELEKGSGRPVDAVSPAAIASGADLSGYDSVVVDDMGVPPAALAALDAYARGGGQLVLTDRSVRLAADLGIVPASALTVDRTDAGHVDFVAPLGDHPYEKGLVGKPSQTYYEVMLGFPSQGRAPNHGIVRTAWEAAGGTTVATVGPQGGASPNTALGSVPRGAGEVVVFGAVLPQAVEQVVLEDGTHVDTPHPFGLADYAVTITGGRVLDNVLSYARPAAAAPAAPAPATTGPAGASAAPAACPSPSPVALGRSTVVSGSSAPVAVTGAPGALVDVVAYTRPSTAYRVVRTLRTGADGRATTTLTPPASTRLYAQQQGCAPGPSSVLTVRASVSLDARRTGGRTVTFGGSSLPRREGGLAVALYRVGADGREVLTARTRTDPGTGRWTLTRTTGGGRHRFVARTPGTADTAAGASAVRTVPVG